MSGSLTIRNRQRAVRVKTRPLRRISLVLLQALLRKPDFDLGVYLVGAPEMTRLNETFLHHAGPTDVITFEYGFGVPPSGGPGAGANPQPAALHGELFICPDQAVLQARRFRTHWQEELVRYVVHGILHLNGYDDRRSADRRRMKSAENRLLRQLEQAFDFKELGCRTVARPPSRAETRRPQIAPANATASR